MALQDDLDGAFRRSFTSEGTQAILDVSFGRLTGEDA